MKTNKYGFPLLLVMIIHGIDPILLAGSPIALPPFYYTRDQYVVLYPRSISPDRRIQVNINPYC